MNLSITRFDYNRRGGMAWATLLSPPPDSALDGPAPTIEMQLDYAVRATQNAPVNDQQIVVPHPLVVGLYIVVWFVDADKVRNSDDIKVDWPPQAAYRSRAVQLLANMVACAESEHFGSVIPRIIP